MADVLCPVVVGRESELRALEESLSNAVGGQGGCLFVTGEPGIGKSRLVREICRSADSRGAMAVVGRAVLAGASVPFRPLTEALLQALRVRPLVDRVGLDPWLPALGAIVPGLAADAPAAEASAAVRGEAVVTVQGSFTKAKFNDQMAQFNGTAVSAIGDAAFLVRASAFVAVLKGSTEVMLERNNPLVSQDEVDSLEALARTAAGRL